MNGMKVGSVTSSPWAFATMKCPISWTRIRITKPTPNRQPQMSAYAPTEMKIPKNFSRTKPNLTAIPITAASGAQILRKIPRQFVPLPGWIGS